MFDGNFRAVLYFTVAYGCLAAMALFSQALVPPRAAPASYAASGEAQPGIAGLISLAGYDLASSE